MKWKDLLNLLRDFVAHVVMTTLMMIALLILIFGPWQWALAFFVAAVFVGYLTS